MIRSIISLIALSTLLAACTSDEQRGGNPTALAEINRAIAAVEPFKKAVTIHFNWAGTYPTGKEARDIMARLAHSDPKFRIEIEAENGGIFVDFSRAADPLLHGHSLSFLPWSRSMQVSGYRCLSTIEEKEMLPGNCRD